MVTRTIRTALIATAALAAFLIPAASASALNVITNDATNVKSTSATLNAFIQTEGWQTNWVFELGTIENSEEQGGEPGEIPAKVYAANVSRTVTGLQPNTKYYYRIHAFNGKQYVIGAYKTFTTFGTPKFYAGSYPTTITGEEAQAGAFKLTMKSLIGSVTADCSNASSNGTISGATTSLSVGATYSNCQFNGENATVSMNSCRYQLNVSNAGPPYVGTAAIVCEKEGDAITVTGGICNISAPAQSLGTVEYANSGTGTGAAVNVTIPSQTVKLTFSPAPEGSCLGMGSKTPTTISGSLKLAGSNGVYIAGEFLP